MKTIQNNFKRVLLLIVIFISVSSCKKENGLESDQEKFEKAMLVAGFKLVDEKDIPKDVVPYELNQTEIANFLEEVKNKSMIYSLKNNIQATIKGSLAIGDEDEPDFEGSETKNFNGSTQYYYFNNCNVLVNLSFKKNNTSAWLHSTHKVTVSNAEGGGTANYYQERSYNASFDGNKYDFKSSGDIYYKGFGSTYNIEKNIIGSSLGSQPFRVSISN